MLPGKRESQFLNCLFISALYVHWYIQVFFFHSVYPVQQNVIMVQRKGDTIQKYTAALLPLSFQKPKRGVHQVFSCKKGASLNQKVGGIFNCYA